MRKSSAWKYVLYGLMVVYIVYIVMSMSHLNEKMEFLHQYPVRTARETREVRARVHELENILPGLLSNSNVTYEEVMSALERQATKQNASLADIKASFRGDPKLVENLLERYNKMRDVRANLVKKLMANTSYETAMEAYQKEIVPLMDSIDDALGAISQNSDQLAAHVLADMNYRMNLTILFSVVVGAVIIVIFLMADRREKAKNREIAYRDGLFNQLSQNVDEVFIITSGGEKFNYVSPNSKRIFNLKASEIEKSATILYNFLPAKASEWLKDKLDHMQELHGPVEMDAHLPSLEKYFKIRIHPFKLAAKHAERAIVSISDQTLSLRNQETLRGALASANAASAAKSSFLSHMSHEIRTPMNAIIGMTTIAIARIGDQTRVMDCLSKISDSSRHLLSLINDILDMSKIESGKMALHPEEFNLNHCVRNIGDMVRPQAENKKLNFDILMENVDVEEMIGDYLRLNQVLINILSNACKFTPPGGNIVLKIQQSKKQGRHVHLRFVISDTGIGMSKEDLQRLYQPFEQASAATATKYGGTGLGMAITLNLVSMMGGRLDVSSKPGKGTTFTVELPFELTEKEAANNDSLPPLKILVVDDDYGTCEHATLLLEKMGLHPKWTLSPRDAIKMARDAHEAGDGFDVCLIDWKMPEMDGAETARRIREVVGEDVLIIIISAYDWTPIEDDARKAGINDFVAKPFFASSLYDTLLSATKRMALKEGGEAETEKSGYDFSGDRILLVEDNEFNREIAQEFLEMVNAEVEYAENGKEAVDKFLASPPHYYNLVLMDVQMPIKDGYEATQEIRASTHPDAKTIPILAMTANAFSEDVAHAHAAGMNAHLAKPIDVKALYEMLARFLPPPKPDQKKKNKAVAKGAKVDTQTTDGKTAGQA